MSWTKEVLTQGIEFSATPTKIRNGTASPFAKGDLLQFDTDLSTASASYGAKNHKFGDDNSGWYVCILSEGVGGDGSKYFAVAEEVIPAAGGTGKAWLRHPHIGVACNAGLAAGTGCSAASSGALDTTPPATSKIIAISQDADVSAGIHKVAFNGVEGFGIPD